MTTTTAQVSAEPQLRDLHRWFTLKAQQLQIEQELLNLESARAFLLASPHLDKLAAAYGLRLSRTDGTVYHYSRDADLERKRLRLQVLKEQLQQGQAAFREACRQGQKELELDYSPARRLRLELAACAVEQDRS